MTRRLIGAPRGGMLQKTSFIGEPDVGSRDDFPIVITAMPANARQRKIAFGAFIFIVVIAVANAPFAHIQLGHVHYFVPVVQTAMCIANLLTAVFLFTQYSMYPQRALLALAGGFTFSGLFAILHTIAFPAAHSATTLIGDKLNSPTWLFTCWQVTFSLAVIVYALSKDGSEPINRVGRSTRADIGVTIVCVAIATAALTWVATAGVEYLPTPHQNVVHRTPFGMDVTRFVALLNATALAVLFVRRRTLLDQWLMVTLVAWLPSLVMAALFNDHRFSEIWYLARVYALFAGSALLFVLLAETMTLYTRLADAILLSRRERANRLTSVDAATSAMAHEIRQPLAGLAAQGSAGLNWLRRSPPNLDKVRDCLTGIVESSHRAEDIISSIRELFKTTPGSRTMVQINYVTREALALARHDLDANDVTVATEYQENIPTIDADRTQLQQVILNLVNNAIEAMQGVSPDRRRLRISTGFDGKSVVSIYIQDTGAGIAPEDQHRLFDPFFTTKPSGTGLGLSICRTIVEEHGGNLRLAKTDPQGSSFEISIPISSTSDDRSAVDPQTVLATTTIAGNP
jgi:signal transduction histidine kinase